MSYYTLAAVCVTPEDASPRVQKSGGLHQIPVIVLARLGVDKRVQREGIGKKLVRDALSQSAAAADIISARAILVHMKRPELRGYYEAFDFEPSPVSDSQMLLLMKDLRKALA